MNEHIVAKELNDELIFYDMKKEAFHILNVTAKLIYTLYQTGNTIQEIEVSVKKHFNITTDLDIKEDIQQCLQGLRKKGLLRA